VVLPALANIGTTPVIVAVAVPTTIVIATTTVIRSITAPVTAQPTAYHTIAPVFALYAVAAVAAVVAAEKAEKVIPHHQQMSILKL
jgi:hypothetical protein